MTDSYNFCNENKETFLMQQPNILNAVETFSIKAWLSSQVKSIYKQEI